MAFTVVFFGFVVFLLTLTGVHFFSGIDVATSALIEKLSLRHMAQLPWVNGCWAKSKYCYLSILYFKPTLTPSLCDVSWVMKSLCQK
jgi:hypothetical protein